MKCASSTVCRYLELHPQVDMVPNLEPRFFSDDEIWNQGFSWYEGLFDGHEGRLQAEGTNDYSWTSRFPHVVDRIADYQPSVKLVFIVRHPIDRIVSAYIQVRTQSPQSMAPTLDAALVRQRETLVEQSLYKKQLSPYLNRFDRKQFFVGFMEELDRDPHTFFNLLTDFLGIDEFFAREDEEAVLHKNKSAGRRVPGKRYTAFSSLPLYKSLKKASPEGFRTWLKDRFFTDPAETIVLSEDVRAKLLEEVRPDAEVFLRTFGRDEDFWDLR